MVMATIWTLNMLMTSCAKAWMSRSSSGPMSPSTICLAEYCPQPIWYNPAISSMVVINTSTWSVTMGVITSRAWSADHNVAR